MPSASPQWLIENGIGETRSLLVDGETILAAKLHWPGELRSGDRVTAQLISKRSGARRGTAKTEASREVLVDHLPSDITEGASIKVQITRAAIAERGRLKHAQGRALSNEVSQNGTVLSQNDTNDAPNDANEKPVARFPAGLWEDVWHAASSASLDFTGGQIVISPTPAMTLIDIDGDMAPRELALAAIPAISRALRWMHIGGNIGIDFPTLGAKADRRAVDEALASALSDWPHERTAMNGFGFVQIIARLEGPSLLHRFAASRTGMCARYALRVAELAQGTGPVLLLRVHPALKAKLKPDWLSELNRRTGKELRIETDPGLALETPQAQIVSP